MNTLDIKEGKETETGTEKTAKITITLQSESKLDEMVQRVNDGFSGGRVTRQDLASWALQYFKANAFVACVEEIRKDHFDQLAHMESLLRQAKEARRRGADATEIASILSGSAPSASRVSKKRLKKEDDQPKLAV